MEKPDDAQAGFTQQLHAAGEAALSDLKTTTAPQEPAPPITEPATPPVPDDAPAPVEEYEIKVDGQVIKVKDVEELKALAQKGVHFTKRSQEVADRDRALSQKELLLNQQALIVQNQAAQIQQLLQNPEQLKAYVQQVQAQYAPVPGASSPDDIPTAGQVRQALEAQAHELESKAQQAISEAVLQAKFELETARYRNDYSTLVEQTLGSLKREFTSLDAVDDIDLLIKGDVGKIVEARIKEQPDFVPTNDELQAMLRESAQHRAQKLERKFTDHAKTAVARSAKLAATGTEPPGGTPPKPAPTQHFRLGDPRLTAQVIQDLEEAGRRK